MTIRVPRSLALLGVLTAACASQPSSRSAAPVPRKTAAESNDGSPTPPSAVAAPATAQEAQQEAYRATSRGHYLDAVLLLENFSPEKIAPSERSSFYQALGVMQSWVGDGEASLKSFDESSRAFQPAGSNPLNQIPSDAKLVPAIPLIAQAARERRAIFVNEAHHVPRHRALTFRLLRELRDMGYTHFAAETISASDEAELNERSYPTLQSGYYSSEPIFGALLREARRLGFRIVAYEDLRFCQPKPTDGPEHCQNMREEGQAANLKAKIFDKSPGAKVVVHAGYGHVYKRGLNGWKPMAVYFKEKTGIDPLVVDQTFFSEKGGVEFDSGSYLAAQELLENPKASREPMLIETSNGTLFMPPLTSMNQDLQVFHPRAVYHFGRETWREMGGRRVFVEFPRDPCGAERPCLLEARRMGEPSEGRTASVPADLILVRDGQPSPSLVLPRGASYRVRAWGRGGRLLSEQASVLAQ